MNSLPGRSNKQGPTAKGWTSGRIIHERAAWTKYNRRCGIGSPVPNHAGAPTVSIASVHRGSPGWPAACGLGHSKARAGTATQSARALAASVPENLTDRLRTRASPRSGHIATFGLRRLAQARPIWAPLGECCFRRPTCARFQPLLWPLGGAPDRRPAFPERRLEPLRRARIERSFVL